jgi:hypothetical protein
MVIGIVFDSHTGDYWYRIEKDIDSVKTALSSIRLPLPVAGIFDFSKNGLVRLDHNYSGYRTELVRIARLIFRSYLPEREI